MNHYKLSGATSRKDRMQPPKVSKLGRKFPNFGNINLKVPNQRKTSLKENDLDAELIRLHSQLLENEEALLSQVQGPERSLQAMIEMHEDYPSLAQERKARKPRLAKHGNKTKNKSLAKQLTWKALMGQIGPLAFSSSVPVGPEKWGGPHNLRELSSRDDTESREKPLHSRFMLGRNHAMSAATDSLLGLMSAGWSTTPEVNHREEIRKRFSTRREALRAACQHYANSSLFRPLSKILGITYSPLMNNSVRFCPVEKTGSTTWGKIFNQIKKEHRHNTTHALAYEVGSGKTGKALKGGQGLSRTETSIVFVREPYARLLSAYVDKLFGPNSAFWFQKGRYIITNFRHTPRQLSLKCGHDVSFPEFIRYVIHAKKTGKMRDGHFSPIHDHCGFCRKHYDFIGHMETFQEDLDFLLDVLHSNVNYTIEKFEKNTIKNNAEWVFRKMRTDIQVCISMDKAARRLWKKWQIRGLISKEDPLPLAPGEAETVEMSRFVDMAYDAVVRSGGKSKLKEQKLEALREAYSTVPLPDRLQLKEIFSLDFRLFGYDPEPEFVFPKQPYQSKNGFRYLQL